MREWSIHVPFAKPPLTANQRLHWAAKADITRRLRSYAAHSAKTNGIPPLKKCRVELLWVVKDRRKRDTDNVVPTLKALADGLVDAGVVPDDTPEWMEKVMPAIRHDKWDKPHLELTITEVYA